MARLGLPSSHPFSDQGPLRSGHGRGPILRPEMERARLRRHFARTLDVSGSRTPALPTGRLLERKRLLRELERYARAERFPRNRKYPGLAPSIFVDDEGNRCAVGHLMDVSGAGKMVAAVRERSNLAKVATLAGLLAPWAEHVGITLEEAARIQPGYCFVTAAFECLCGTLPSVGGVLEGEVVSVSSPAVLRVDVVHGEAPYAVGDEIEAYGSGELGAHALVPVRLDGEIASGSTIVLDDHAELACSGLTAPREAVIDAMLSGDCAGTLEEVDEAWTASPCEDGGCAVAHGSPATAGALAVLALVSLLRRHGARR
jgi:hypothetical protein